MPGYLPSGHWCSPLPQVHAADPVGLLQGLVLLLPAGGGRGKEPRGRLAGQLPRFQRRLIAEREESHEEDRHVRVGQRLDARQHLLVALLLRVALGQEVYDRAGLREARCAVIRPEHSEVVDAGRGQRR